VAARSLEVVIVGGGIVGAALAAWLARAGISVAVVEKASARPFRSLGRDCRVSTLGRGVELALADLGGDALLAGAAELVAMRIWDDQRPRGLRFDAAEIGEPRLGVVVENAVLRERLQRIAEEAGALWLHDAPARLRLRVQAVELALQSGQVLEARLAVGADGARSWLREQAGIRCWASSYGQRGITATVRLARAHGGVACQRFLRTGPLALLPLAEERLASIVWSAWEDEADRLMRLDDSAFLQALNEALGPVFGGVVEVGARASFPLERRLAHHLVRKRIALAGDAAHVIHPLAGLGVNLGLRDAIVLADEVVQAKRFGEDFGALSVLGRYRDRRIFEVLATLAAMEGFHRLFTAKIPALGALRAWGMTAFGQLAWLKRIVMRQAAGLAVDAPRAIG